MLRSSYNAPVILFMLAVALFAGPKIEFDTKSFNCGYAIEGKADKVTATFAVKNTGDALLKLESVKPGCGCTVVKYDTLIQPGKTAKIESTVNIVGYSSGPISKSVTVTSNAENEQIVRLVIEATILPVIDVSGTVISLDESNAASPKTVILATNKSDLKITDVIFNPFGNSKTSGKKVQLPVSIKHLWEPTDSTRTDGYRIFRMNLFYPVVEEPLSGEFIIRTNHPDKPTLLLRGDIIK